MFNPVSFGTGGDGRANRWTVKSMNREQWAIFNSKPIARMRWFASLLSWRGLQLERVVFSDQQIAKWNVPQSGIVTYFVTPDLKFNLQINETPNGQSVTHQATIKADRYGIANIGWRPFTLHDDNDPLRAKAERLVFEGFFDNSMPSQSIFDIANPLLGA